MWKKTMMWLDIYFGILKDLFKSAEQLRTERLARLTKYREFLEKLDRHIIQLQHTEATDTEVLKSVLKKRRL